MRAFTDTHPASSDPQLQTSQQRAPRRIPDAAQDRRCTPQRPTMPAAATPLTISQTRLQMHTREWGAWGCAWTCAGLGPEHPGNGVVGGSSQVIRWTFHTNKSRVPLQDLSTCAKEGDRGWKWEGPMKAGR